MLLSPKPRSRWSKLKALAPMIISPLLGVAIVSLPEHRTWIAAWGVSPLMAINVINLWHVAWVRQRSWASVGVLIWGGMLALRPLLVLCPELSGSWFATVYYF